MIESIHRLTHSNGFSRVIIALILLSGVLVGLETYPRFGPSTRTGQLILLVQDIILWLFAVEIVLKILACGSKPWQYFLVPWNLFDFIIVVVCFLPFETRFAVVFRMARLLRAMRLLTILPRLQVLVQALLRSIPSLTYVGLLMLLHFYIYAVLGTFLFSNNDPIRFGRLHDSMMTLFEVLTLEGWNDIFHTQSMGSDTGYDEEWKLLTQGQRVSQAQPVIAATYFISFIMLGTMIMLNLFTGVIISSMEHAQEEAEEETRQRSRPATLSDEMTPIVHQLRELASQLHSMRERASRLETEPPRPPVNGE